MKLKTYSGLTENEIAEIHIRALDEAYSEFLKINEYDLCDKIRNMIQVVMYAENIDYMLIEN